MRKCDFVGSAEWDCAKASLPRTNSRLPNLRRKREKRPADVIGAAIMVAKITTG